MQSDSEDDDQDDEQEIAEDVPLGGDDDDIEEDGLKVQNAVVKETGKMNVALRNVNISGGKVIIDGRAESGRTEMEGKHGTKVFRFALVNELVQ